MAQAPQGGGGGAPRQNKTVKEFKGMNTQNRRNAIPEGSFGWLENIQPIGPGHLHSIPGRSSSVVRIPPTPPPPPGCTDATKRGQQVISIEDRFDQRNSAPTLGLNLHTSWAYMTAAEEVYSLIGEASCGGGNMNYADVCVQINHFSTPAVLSHPALIEPNGLLAAFTTAMGNADEPVYSFRSTDAAWQMYYPNSSSHAQLNLVANTFFDGGGMGCFFAKIDTSVYIVGRDLSEVRHIYGYSTTGGNFINDFTPFPAKERIGQIVATAGFLYCTGSTDFDSPPQKQYVKKIDRGSGALVATFFLDNINVQGIGVVNDNLIYVFCNGDPASLYYIDTFTDLVFVGYTAGQGVSPFGPATAMFVGGALYYGSSGNGGFTTDIFKIAVACPDGGAIIATVTRGAASVAAGDPITASWADVLVPNAGDTIQLRPKPTGGELGFVGGALATQAADGTGTGSISFTIPGGTTPGDYVFMYAAIDKIYVATSASFAVT